MKRIYILFFISLLSGPLFSQWTPQISGLTNNLRGVFFLNETTGFAVGESFAPNLAPILKTVDGGANWLLKSSDTKNPLRDIAFNNNVKGFACGLYGTLLKSNDMGDTWLDLNLGYSISFRAIDFPSKEVGYVAGEGGAFLKTTDIGVSWDSLNTGITQDLLNIEFLNNDTGYATGSTGFSNGIIIRTLDGGASWQTVFTSTQAIPALAVTKNNKVFAGGGTSPNGGHEFIVRSEDGGDTWEEVYVGPSGFSIRSATFSSNIAGWFVDDAGTIIKTKNGGDTWSASSVSLTGLNSIFFTEEDTGYAVGALGSIFKFNPCSEPLVLLGNITGETTICNGTTTIYSVSPVSGANSYEWTVPEDASIVYIQGDTLVAVTFGNNSGNVSVAAEADCDTSVASLPVSVIPPLQEVINISGATDFCAGDTGVYSITPIDIAISYNWAIPSDATIIFQSDTTITVALGTSSGTIQITVANNCDTVISGITANVHFPLPPIGEISGDTAVCLASVASYHVPQVPDAFSYDWTVPPGASIIYSVGDTLIVIQFDSSSGNIAVTANGICDSVSASFAVEVVGQFFPIDTIYGATSTCEGSTVSYFVAPVSGADDYIWTVPADATILSGQGDTLIVVSFGESSGEVELSAGTGNCNTAIASLPVNVTPLLEAPGDITGVTLLCSGDTAFFIVSDVAGANFYNWQIPEGANLISGQGETLIAVIFGDNSGEIIFSAYSICDTVSSALLVTVHPTVPPIHPIIGPASVCTGDTATYSIADVFGVDYSWTVPFDATIISSQGDTVISVLFGNSSDGIAIVAGSVCALQDTFLEVNVLPFFPIQPISGDTLACSGDTVSYSIGYIPGAEFTWTVPADASIIALNGDTSITVQFGNTSGNISVQANSACAFQEDFLAVTVVAFVPIQPISGASSVCTNDTATYSINELAGVDYVWSVPFDAEIIASFGDTAITVKFGNSSDGISVIANSPCTVQDTFLAVSVAVFAPILPIVGETTACIGDTATYYIGYVAGVDYSWTVPFDAAVIGLEGDTSITVLFFGDSSEGISVVATSGCAVQDTFLAVTIIAFPPIQSIVGPASVCSGDTATYAIGYFPGVDYSWTVPFDATIISSAGDTSITVLFGNISDDIKVMATNVCSQQEAILPVNVVAYPAVPLISFINNDLVSSEPIGNQWYLDGATIGGATSQIYTPLVNGTYSVIVTYLPGCSTASDTFIVLSVGTVNLPKLAKAIISPNPFESFTTLQFANNFQLNNSTLAIQDVQGKIVVTLNHLTGNTVKIFRNTLPDGIYFFKVTDENNNRITTGKLIVQ